MIRLYLYDMNVKSRFVRLLIWQGQKDPNPRSIDLIREVIILQSGVEALQKILCKNKSNQTKVSLPSKQDCGFPLNGNTPAV